MKSFIMEHPEIIEESMKGLQARRMAAKTEATRVALRTNRGLLERDPRDFVLNPEGKVTVVEFYDYRCAHCKRVAPEVLKLADANPDVRFVFKELPIFGGPSQIAARIILSKPARPRTREIHAEFMDAKALDQATVTRILERHGVDPGSAVVAADDPEIGKHLSDNLALANALEIKGTPAFIVEGSVIRGADLLGLGEAITKARSKVGPLALGAP